MRTPMSMEYETASHLLRVAEVGREKSGKSKLAATGRKPVLFLDTDQRRQSVAGMPGVYAITYADDAWPKQPTAFSEILDDITKIEEGAALRDLDPSFDCDLPPATLVPDSMATLSKVIMAYELYSNKDLRREISIGGKMKVFFPKGFDAWNAEMTTMENFILRILGLPMDVICIFHEAAEEAPDSTDEHPKYTGRIAPFPARHGRLLKYFNEVWRVERTGLIPSVQLVPNYNFTAATTLLLDKVEKPDICEMIRLHEKKLREINQPKSKSQLKGIS